MYRAVGCENDEGDNEAAFTTDLEPHRAEGYELGRGEGVKGRLKKKWQYGKMRWMHHHIISSNRWLKYPQCAAHS